MYKPLTIRKAYWTRQELAAELDLNPSAIGYWEKGPFRQFLHPAVRGRSVRRYTASDRAMIHRIHHLLKVDKLKTEGAIQILRSKHETKCSPQK